MRLLKQVSCVLLVLVFLGCSNGTDSGGEEDNGENEPTEYSLSATANPYDGGSVEPSSGTFDDGNQVTVEATASEGWAFSDWSGDQTSDDNPFTFTITKDTELTANFIENESTEYAISVTTSPSEGGSVDPTGGTYQEGSEVSIEATANEGWKFVEWTGDRTTDENPLLVTITEDIDLTANFQQLNSTYRMEMIVFDAEDTLSVGFGQTEDATAGFDGGIDEEAPPPPPAGALNAYFQVNELQLFKDFRNNASQQVEWSLGYQVGSGEELNLEWERADNSQIPGTLILTDEASSFEVNMLEEKSYSISQTTSGTLRIIFSM